MNIALVTSVILVIFLSETPNCFGQEETINSLGLEACIPLRDSSKCRKTLADIDEKVFIIASNMKNFDNYRVKALKKALAIKFKSEYLRSLDDSSKDEDETSRMGRLVPCMPPKVSEQCAKSLRDEARDLFMAAFKSGSDQDEQNSALMKALIAYFKNEYLL